MTPKDVHVLIPGTCEHITLLGKGNFCRCYHIKDIDMGDCPGLSGRVLVRERQEGQPEKT